MSTTDTTTNQHEPTGNHTIYRAEIGIGAYIVAGKSDIDARMKAAAKYKESLDGPDIGKYVSDYAEDVELSPVNVNIKSQTNFQGEYDRHNGDPYIAIFTRTEPQDDAPSAKRVITLGTNFRSFDEIIHEARDILIAPKYSSAMNNEEPLEFAPTRVDIFELSGTASFEYESMDS